MNNEKDNYQEKVYIPNLSIDLLNKIETEDEQINLKIPLLMDDKNKDTDSKSDNEANMIKLNTENNTLQDNIEKDIIDSNNLKIPTFDSNLVNNEENKKLDKKINIDEVLDNLRQKNEEQKRKNIPNINWFENLKAPKFDKTEFFRDKLNKNDIEIEPSNSNSTYYDYDFNNEKHEDITISTPKINSKTEKLEKQINKKEVLNNKYKIDNYKIDNKIEFLQYEQVPQYSDLNKTNEFEAVNKKQNNLIETKNNNYEDENENEIDNNTMNNKSFLQRIKSDSIYNVDE